MPCSCPASLQVNRRARRVKTDRIDVLMLVQALMAVDRGDRHVCSIVRGNLQTDACEGHNPTGTFTSWTPELIRVSEIQQGLIPHMLAYATPTNAAAN